MDLHELTAAYALDALDADESEAYEAHLAQCERCRTELAALSEAATALAFGVPAPPAPPRLRTAVLDAAAAERANVAPLPRRQWAFRVAAAAAAAAACAAIGLGVWGASRGGSAKEALSAVVVVGADRHATLTVSGLRRAPQGKTYEAWIIPPGGRARPAGLFEGGGRTVVHLLGTVPSGSTVAATVERAGGASAPSSAPFFAATA
jgi:anti-sigma-K factor RskA